MTIEEIFKKQQILLYGKGKGTIELTNLEKKKTLDSMDFGTMVSSFKWKGEKWFSRRESFLSKKKKKRVFYYIISI